MADITIYKPAGCHRHHRGRSADGPIGAGCAQLQRGADRQDRRGACARRRRRTPMRRRWTGKRCWTRWREVSLYVPAGTTVECWTGRPTHGADRSGARTRRMMAATASGTTAVPRRPARRASRIQSGGLVALAQLEWRLVLDPTVSSRQ